MGRISSVWRGATIGCKESQKIEANRLQRGRQLCSPAAGFIRVPDETTFRSDEAVLKQMRRTNMGLENGSDHVSTHPQPNLPRVSQERPFGHGEPRGNAMTEVVTALFAFFSVSVFLAHVFDAYRVR
jgi:hypothetical protein